MKQKIQVLVRRWDENAKDYRYLILKTLPNRGGFYQPITGSVEKGERYEDAAYRELQEETGIQAQDLKGELVFLHEFEFEDENGVRNSERAYLATLTENKTADISNNPVLEHESVEWMEFEDALRHIAYETNKKTLLLAKGV